MKGEEVVVPGVAPEQYRAGVLRQRLRKRFLKKVLEYQCMSIVRIAESPFKQIPVLL